MDIKFTKMHGLGNDFMVLDLVSQELEITPQQIQQWSDRHTGIGFDQLLIIEPPDQPDADFGYRVFNADGSQAEQCGNGARCVAKLIADLELSSKSTLVLQTNTGRIETRRLHSDSADLRTDTVEVNMGRPRMAAQEVPFNVAAALSSEHSAFVLTTLERQFSITPISMGNPHGVIFVDDIASTPVAEIGQALTCHPFFPQQANIGFCQIVDSGFVRLRVFERGVGETQACGTGACAAAVAGHLHGKLADKVKVSLPGGKVRIHWRGGDSPVKMTGPATFVYGGFLAA